MKKVTLDLKASDYENNNTINDKPSQKVKNDNLTLDKSESFKKL